MRNLVMEPMRRRTTAQFPEYDPDRHLNIDDLLKLVDDSHIDDNEYVVNAVQSIYKHALLAEVLSMDEFAPLKTKLLVMKASEARELLQELRSIPCAEAKLVDWSTELTYTTGSNTAPIHMGAGKSALAAMFYLVKYFKKEAGRPNTALAVLIDARDHINEYGSTGTDSTSPAHFARHLLQRAINKSDEELSGTQSASVVLGFKSYQCTDAVAYVDNHCALRELEIETSFLNKGQIFLEDRDEDDVEFPKEGDTKKSGFDQDEIMQFDSDEDADKDDEETYSPSSKVYTIQTGSGELACKIVVAVSQGENFKFRGDALRMLNFVQYSNMISIEKNILRSSKTNACQEEDVEQETSGPGRKSSKIFAFDPLHPLAKSYVQKIKERFTCPIRAGGVRPAFPKLLSKTETPSAAWLIQEERAAAFYIANFIPWSTSNLPTLSASTLRAWIQEQHRISKDIMNFSWEQRVVALGVLQEFKNYAYLTQLSKTDVSVSRQFRQRNRKMWDNTELAEYYNSCGGEKAAEKADNAIDALRKRQEARKTDIRRKYAAERHNDWVGNLMTEFSTIYEKDGKSTPPLSVLKQNLCREHVSPKPADVVLAAANLHKKDADNDDDTSFSAAVTPRVQHDFSLCDVDSKSIVPYVFDNVDQCKYPEIFKRVSNVEYEEERTHWELHFEVAFKRGDSNVPRPPSNPEQRDLMRRVLRQVRSANIAKIHFAATNEDLRVTLSSPDIGVLAIGAAGVGKSHALDSLIFIVNHENLGNVLSICYTGVATVQVRLTHTHTHTKLIYF